MAYTQEQINAALAAELTARPTTSAYDLANYAMKTYGITTDQINQAYKALDTSEVPTTIDYNYNYGTSALTPRAANSAGYTGPSHTVINPETKKITELVFAAPGFNPNDPFTLQQLGFMKWVGNGNNGQVWYDNFATPAQKAAADTLWAQDWQKLNAQDVAKGTVGAFTDGKMPANQAEALRISTEKINAFNRANNINTNTADAPDVTEVAGVVGTTQTTPTGLLDVGRTQTDTQQFTRDQGVATKAYSPAEVAAYNAYRAGDIAGVNRAVQSGNLTRAQVQSSFGLNDADMNWLVNNSGVKFYTPTTVTGVTTGGTTVGNKTYTQAETDLYNAYRGGNIAEVNRLLAANKWTGADIKSKFGLTDADISWITNNAGGKFYNPAATTDITKVINTIGGTTTPAGQFPELFPSFAESQRLAGQMIANRPTTQSIVDMISNPQNPALTSAWQTAEKTGQYGDVAGMLQNMPIGKVQSAYGLSNADLQYIMSRPEIATALSQTGTAAPTLNNVLGMISK
jgi:hypothetical protein